MKNKILSTILSIVIIISTISYVHGTENIATENTYVLSNEEQEETKLSSEELICGDFEYKVNDDCKTATITNYIGGMETVEIPSTLDGYTITSIGEWSFFGLTD